MEFTFETTYDLKALTVMARAVRKTVRKKKNRRSRVLGWIVVILGLLLTLPIGGREFEADFRTIITLLAVIVMVLALLFEDQLNGYIAGKRMLPGMKYAKGRFTEDGYVSETGVGKTEFYYHTIDAIAENQQYFVFAIGNNHAQVYEKSRIGGGTIEEFHAFLEEKTGKNIQKF